MASAHRPSPRFYDLDALRAGAMFLGIVLHTCLFVMPEPVWLWPLHDPAAAGDPTYGLLLDAIHGFRMPVFFLLSGFFSALLWQRRSLRELGMQRLRRVGIPFVIACFTILPLSVLFLAFIAGRQAPYDFPLWTLLLVWVQFLGHLWFLWYLLLMAGCFIIAARLGLQFRHPAWWLVIPATMALSLVMTEPVFGPDTAVGIVPEPALFAHYAGFFIFGAFFYRQSIAVRRWWTVALLPAAAAFVAGLYLLHLYGERNPEVFMAYPYRTAFLFRNWLTLAGGLVEAVFAWLMCFGTMGLFRWVAARESFAVRYLSDATYWMYLMHLPLVIVGQWLVLGWPIHYHLKFLLVCAGVTALVLATYQLGVRYTIIGRTLNGPRTRRRPAPPGQPQPAGSG